MLTLSDANMSSCSLGNFGFSGNPQVKSETASILHRKLDPGRLHQVALLIPRQCNLRRWR